MPKSPSVSLSSRNSSASVSCREDCASKTKDPNREHHAEDGEENRGTACDSLHRAHSSLAATPRGERTRRQALEERR